MNSLLPCTSWPFLVLLLYLFLLFWLFSWVTVHAGFNYPNYFWGFFFSEKKSHHCPSVNYINLSWEARDYVPKTFLWKTPAVSYFADLLLPWDISRSKVVVFIEWWGVWGLRNPSLQISTYLVILRHKTKFLKRHLQAIFHYLKEKSLSCKTLWEWKDFKCTVFLCCCFTAYTMTYTVSLKMDVVLA